MSNSKLICRIKKLLYSIGKYIICIYVILFCVAFIMKGHANNEWVKNICKEFVYGPKNMIALVVNKVRPDTMEINSVFLPKQPEPKEESWEEKRIREVLQRYKQQVNIDEKLKAEYESGEYSLDDPFVVVNPYGISPLTALVMFDTDEEVQVAVKVMGNQPEENIELSIGGGTALFKKTYYSYLWFIRGERKQSRISC